jgi:hypothetical protein
MVIFFILKKTFDRIVTVFFFLQNGKKLDTEKHSDIMYYSVKSLVGYKECHQ